MSAGGGSRGGLRDEHLETDEVGGVVDGGDDDRKAFDVDVQVALGDLPHGSIGYQTIFAAGLTLLLITLAFNIAGQWLRRRFREAY